MQDLIDEIIVQINEKWPQQVVLAKGELPREIGFPVAEIAISFEVPRIIVIYNTFPNKILIICQQFFFEKALHQYAASIVGHNMGSPLPHHYDKWITIEKSVETGAYKLSNTGNDIKIDLQPKINGEQILKLIDVSFKDLNQAILKSL